jgi:hypothetical protein
VAEGAPGESSEEVVVGGDGRWWPVVDREVGEASFGQADHPPISGLLIGSSRVGVGAVLGGPTACTTRAQAVTDADHHHLTHPPADPGWSSERTIRSLGFATEAAATRPTGMKRSRGVAGTTLLL